MQLHFIIEVTWDIFIYDAMYILDVLDIFDINLVFLVRYANLFDFWFDKRQRQV